MILRVWPSFFPGLVLCSSWVLFRIHSFNELIATQPFLLRKKIPKPNGFFNTCKGCIHVQNGLLLLLAFLFFLIPFHGFSAEKNKLTFFSFGVNEGLTQGNVTCMMKDHKGMMWFGTWDGVNLYDGFRNMDFSNPDYNNQGIRGVVINNILEIDSNRVAIATYVGLSIFNRTKNRFEYYPDDEAFRNCRILKSEGDFLILSAATDLRKFDCKQLKFSPFKGNVPTKWKTALQNRKNGVNRSEFLFSRAFDLLEKNPVHFAKIAQHWSSLTINDMVPEPGTAKWYLGCDEGLYVFDPESDQVNLVLAGQQVKSLNGTKDQLFIGTQVSGLFVLDFSSRKISANYRHSETNKRTLTGNYIRNIFVDQNQRLWLSVLGGGVNFSSLSENKATTIFSYADLPTGSNQDNYIQSLTEDSTGRLWLYTVAGKLKVLNADYQLIKTFEANQIDPVRLPSSMQQIYVAADGRLFFLSNKGLYSTRDDGRFLRANCADSSEGANHLQSMIPLFPGTFLVGSRKGLFLFDAARNLLTRLSVQGMDKEIVHFLFQDSKGNIFVNYFFKGIYLFEWKQNALRQKGIFHLNANLKAGIEIENEILFASSKGILRYNFQHRKMVQHESPSGLQGQTLYSLLPDPNRPGTYWCSSNKGIFIYQIQSGQYTKLGVQHGLSSLEFNSNASTKRKNGDFVFGSIDGLTYVSPGDFFGHSQSPPLVLDDFEIQNIPDSSLATFKTDGKWLYRLPFEHNDFSCRLIQVNFPNSETPIRYKLLGLENQWHKGGNPQEIRYSNLPEGDYVLVTEYFDPQQGWKSKRWFSLSITPPWHRTWWARAAFLVLILSLAGLIIRLYVVEKIQKEREEVVKRNVLVTERNRIIKDLNDDLGATLGSISFYTEAIKNKLKNNEQDRVLEMMDKIGENARETISNLGDMVWNLNPKNDSAEKLFARMESTATQLLAPQQIELDYFTDPQLFGIEFSLEAKQNIYLMLKETINNTLKHSGASRVRITIRKNHQNLEMRMEDNGQGFDTTGEQNRSGITNIRLRTEALGGFSEISSSHSGTSWYIRMPISALEKA